MLKLFGEINLFTVLLNLFISEFAGRYHLIVDKAPYGGDVSFQCSKRYESSLRVLSNFVYQRLCSNPILSFFIPNIMVEMIITYLH